MEAERKRKLLWGGKGVVPGSTSLPSPLQAQSPAAVPTAPPGMSAALLGLNKCNPGGRQLNLGLGMDQFKTRKDSQSKEDLDASDKKSSNMTALWSTTTFNNDQDGKMAEKFKRLMGVKGPDSVDGKYWELNVVQFM